MDETEKSRMAQQERLERLRRIQLGRQDRLDSPKNIIQRAVQLCIQSLLPLQPFNLFPKVGALLFHLCVCGVILRGKNAVLFHVGI